MRVGVFFVPPLAVLYLFPLALTPEGTSVASVYRYTAVWVIVWECTRRLIATLSPTCTELLRSVTPTQCRVSPFSFEAATWFFVTLKYQTERARRPTSLRRGHSMSRNCERCGSCRS